MLHEPSVYGVVNCNQLNAGLNGSHLFKSYQQLLNIQLNLVETPGEFKLSWSRISRGVESHSRKHVTHLNSMEFFRAQTSLHSHELYSI